MEGSLYPSEPVLIYLHSLTCLWSLMREITSSWTEEKQTGGKNKTLTRSTSTQTATVLVTFSFWLIFGKGLKELPFSIWGQIAVLSTTSSRPLRIHTDRCPLHPAGLIGSQFPQNMELLQPGSICSTVSLHHAWKHKRRVAHLQYRGGKKRIE